MSEAFPVAVFNRIGGKSRTFLRQSPAARNGQCNHLVVRLPVVEAINNAGLEYQMAKAGEEYQELTALVAKALDPNAEIKTGQWIEGPDGDREVDVEIRGTVGDKPHFIIIECKDWKRRVDIQEIDKLDSKRQDLSAQAAMICSNSGFTKKALRKAQRVDIGAVSAIAAGNRLVRPVIERELVSKMLSVDSFQITLYPNAESESLFSNGWDYTTLRYKGLPVANWLAVRSTELLHQHEGEPKIVELAAFKVGLVRRICGWKSIRTGLWR